MPHFNFHIVENGRFIADERGQDYSNGDAARKEAVATGASIAREAFMAGSASRVVVDVRENGAPFLTISITLDVEETADS